MPTLRNAKQERFAQEIAKGRSLVDAYKAAGFKPDFRNAKRLRDRKEIGQRVDQILTDRERRATLSTERAIERAAITKADVLAMLMEDRKLARKRGQTSAAIRADELLGKELGMFIHREEIGRPGDFSHLSTEELDQRICDELIAGGIPEEYAQAFQNRESARRSDRYGRHGLDRGSLQYRLGGADALRDHGLLALGKKFRRDERRKLVFRGRERRASIGELYERP